MQRKLIKSWLRCLQSLYPTDASLCCFAPPNIYACICNSQQTAAQLSEVSTQCVLSGRRWFAVTYLLSWTTERGLPSSLELWPVSWLCVTAHIPLTHYNSRPSPRCMSWRAGAEKRVDCEQPVDYRLASLTDCWRLCDLVCFPGVLCEGHWHLDGGVPSVCVCCPAGVRSSQLCLKATQGVHQAEEKAAAAKNSKCKSHTHTRTG